MKASRGAIATVIASDMHRLSPSQLSRQVAAYLLSEGRVGETASIMRDVMQLRADKEGTVEVMAYSAHELDAEEIREIESLIRSHYPDCKSVIVSRYIDPTILGGVRLQLAQSQLDLSVRAKLNRLRQLTTATTGGTTT